MGFYLVPVQNRSTAFATRNKLHVLSSCTVYNFLDVLLLVLTVVFFTSHIFNALVVHIPGNL